METQNKIGINNLGALGIDPGVLIAIINGASRLAPFIMDLFQKNKTPTDTWSGWDWPLKTQYVNEGILVAKEAIRQGAATTIEQTMQVIIAQVELDESWEVWKQYNPRYIPIMQQAQSEIDAEMTNNQSLASIFSTKALLWALGFSVLGFGFYWFKFRDKPVKQPLQENKIKKQ